MSTATNEEGTQQPPQQQTVDVVQLGEEGEGEGKAKISASKKKRNKKAAKKQQQQNSLQQQHKDIMTAADAQAQAIDEAAAKHLTAEQHAAMQEGMKQLEAVHVAITKPENANVDEVRAAVAALNVSHPDNARTAMNMHRNTYLHTALLCEVPSEDIIRYLALEVKVDVEAENESGLTALQIAACRVELVATVRMLIEEAQAAVDTQVVDTSTSLLHLAAENGCLETLRYLVDRYGLATTTTTPTKKFKFLKVNGTNNKHMPPLALAIQGNHMETFRYLIEEAGANTGVVHAKDGATALHNAAFAGRLAMATFLIHEKRVSICVADKAGNTSLLYAALGGHIDMVKLLVESARARMVEVKESKTGDLPAHIQSDVLDLDVQTQDGCTPLHIAAHYGHAPVVTYLLGEGARVNLKARDGRGAIHRAIQEDKFFVVKLLLDHGALFCMKDLTAASQKGINKVMGELLGRCYVCHKDTAQTYACPACASRVYCSKECQKVDWKKHGVACGEKKKKGQQGKKKGKK